tara:strand:+ start:8147 stop:8611 length:465 start_codon:yes stop_codon:yes gene_type:complete
MEFNVIIDSREQKPLEFNSSAIDEIIVSKLDEGDYAIAGLEDKLCIERKASFMEVYKNVTEKRFWSEVQRMANYKYKFLVCEFSMSDVDGFPHNTGLPKKIWSKLQVTPQYVMMRLSEIQVKYNIHVVFAGDRDNASYLVTNIMKRVYEAENRP